MPLTARPAADTSRRVLIVSPRFPPTNAADLHRVRASLAHYRRFGWEPSILCLDPRTSDCPEDPMLARALPPDIAVVRVRAFSEAACRRFGFGHLGYRSLLPLYVAGTRLLRRARHDVVFFSTTVFTAFVLGRVWKRRFGCRVVLDFQDPWYTDSPIYSPETVPGSWWKYRLDRALARPLERFALKAADHVITVSPGYAAMLTSRYPWLAREQFTVLPFPAPEEDYAFAHQHGIKQTLLVPEPSVIRWVYAGRGGPDMAPVLDVLFEAVAELRARDTEFAATHRLAFVGTNYAAAERTYKLVEPLARRRGVADLVDERPERVPYFETIALLESCDAILLIGSVDADYTASKLFACVLARKPILALFHRRSLVVEIAAKFPNVFVAAFDQSPAESAFRAQVTRGLEWLRSARFDTAAIDAAVRPWSAEALTRRQCAIFDEVTRRAGRERGLKT